MKYSTAWVFVASAFVLLVMVGCRPTRIDASKDLVGVWIIDKEKYSEQTEAFLNEQDSDSELSPEGWAFGMTMQPDIALAFYLDGTYLMLMTKPKPANKKEGTWKVIESNRKEAVLRITNDKNEPTELNVRFINRDSIEMKSSEITTGAMPSPYKLYFKRD